jgi:glycerol-3-phosphate acyltransferase PlsY
LGYTLFILFLIFSYLIGSIPSGVWIGKKISGLDIREHGSKNTGATNAIRVLGAKIGIIVLLLDILKGAIPLLIGKYLFKYYDDLYLLIIGVVVIIGHILSLFLKFKGGKGVATSLGVFFVIVPKVMITILIIFSIVVYFTRFVSLGSILSALSFSFLTYFYYGVDKIMTIYFGIIIGIYIIYKHKTNIQRLFKGEENKIKFKKE